MVLLLLLHKWFHLGFLLLRLLLGFLVYRISSYKYIYFYYYQSFFLNFWVFFLLEFVSVSRSSMAEFCRVSSPINFIMIFSSANLSFIFLGFFP